MINLSNERQKELVEALVEGFRPEVLEMNVLDPMRVPSNLRSASRSYRMRVEELVRWAISERRLDELLRVALEANSQSARLRLLGEISGVLPPTGQNLLEAMRPALKKGWEEQWMRGLAEATEQVCLIELEGKIAGTGFIAGPDHVMTHVTLLGNDVAKAATMVGRIRVWFGSVKHEMYRVISLPVAVPGGPAVLRLDRPAGREIALGSVRGHSSRGRGWIAPREPRRRNKAVVIVQFIAGDGPAQAGRVTVSVDPEGLLEDANDYLHYRTSTQHGSMGAPCFDADWRLIGMHIAFVPDGGNQGMPVATLVRALREYGFVWDEASGVYPEAAPPRTRATRSAQLGERAKPEAKLDKLVRDFDVRAGRHDPKDDVWSDESLYEPGDPERWAWAEAAATTAYFVPEKLTPLGKPGAEARVAVLLESMLVPQADGEPRWMLSERVRIRALERLDSRGELRKLRAANGGGGNLLDTTLGDLIDGKQPGRADLQDSERCRAIMQAASWLARTKLKLPNPVELRAQLERATMLAPFRHLTRGFFAGRDEQMAQLVAYVDGPDKIEGAAPPPIFIYGPGGMGKSALLSHFILAHSERDTTRPDQWNPFIYLDFDRPELDARDLGGVLLAIARQIGPQAPRISRQSEEFIRRWSQERRGSGPQHNRTAQAKRALLLGDHNRLQTEAMATDLARILSQLTSPPRPLVLVVDTLEEVQYATPEAVASLIDVVINLRGKVPTLRPVLAGRVELPDDAKVSSIRLPPLPNTAAEALLGNHLPPALAAKAGLVSRMVEIVGGNPLSLRLAADVLGREATGKIDELGEAALWQRVGDEIVQGQLYERIVGHLHEGPVKQIAVPGLVLRYLTWELLRDVVAGPCGVKLASDTDARDLFDDLAKEIALVRQGSDASRLVLRPELRRTVLESFRNDALSRDKRREIHEKAIAYFKDRQGTENRAEEIYHRLWLDQDPKEIESRWITGLEGLLRGAVEELAGRARLYLANRVGGALDEQALRNAPLEEWEAAAEKRASDLLRLGLPVQALHVLNARTERLPASRLHVLQSVALRSQSPAELAGAESAAEAAVAAARVSGDPGEMQNALEELTQVRRLRGDTAGVLRALADLGNLGEQLGDDLVLLQSEVEGLEATVSAYEEMEKFSEPAVRVFSRLPDELVARAPELARRVAAQVGSENPAVLQRVIKLVGVGALDEYATASLRDVLEDWANREADVAPFVPKPNASAAELTSATQYLLGNRMPDKSTAAVISDWLKDVVRRSAAASPASQAYAPNFGFWAETDQQHLKN